MQNSVLTSNVGQTLVFTFTDGSAIRGKVVFVDEAGNREVTIDVLGVLAGGSSSQPWVKQGATIVAKLDEIQAVSAE